MNYIEILPNVWHIEESYRVYCTLVVGRKLAILFDTGMGERDLRAFVERTVQTDYLVLCSHGHYDHVGGNHRFDAVYAHPEDWGLLRQSEKDSSYELRPLMPGQSFDLGGLHAQVLSLRGHTKGSVGLLLQEEGLLLAGDALSPRLRLIGPEAASLAELRKTLLSLDAVAFDRYLASHYPHLLTKSQIKVHLHHLERLSLSHSTLCKTGGRESFRSFWKENGMKSTLDWDAGLPCQKFFNTRSS